MKHYTKEDIEKIVAESSAEEISEFMDKLGDKFSPIEMVAIIVLGANITKRVVNELTGD